MRVPAFALPAEADTDLIESLGTILTILKTDVKEKSKELSTPVGGAIRCRRAGGQAAALTLGRAPSYRPNLNLECGFGQIGREGEVTQKSGGLAV
jgi:hypothetical protein